MRSFLFKEGLLEFADGVTKMMKKKKNLDHINTLDHISMELSG